MEVEPILPGEATLDERRVRAGFIAVIVVGEDALPLLNIDVVAAHLAARVAAIVATLLVGDDDNFAVIDDEDRSLASTSSSYFQERSSM